MGTQIKYWLLILLSFYAPTAIAAIPAQLAISQVDAGVSQNPDYRTVKLYVNLLDTNSKPIPSQEIGAKVTIDGQTTNVNNIRQFADTGEGIAYTILLDISATMKGKPFSNAIGALNELLYALKTSNREQQLDKKHKVALITFGDKVTTLFDFTYPAKLSQQLDETKLQANNQKTLLYSAILKAFDLNQRNDQTLPTRRVILLITDGKDDGSGLTLSDLNLDKNDVSIYAIGYSTKVNKASLDNLRGITQLGDGTAYLRNDREFLNIHNKIQQQLVIEASVPEQIQVNSFEKNIQLFVSTQDDKHRIAAQKDVKFYISMSQESPPDTAMIREQFPEVKNGTVPENNAVPENATVPENNAIPENGTVPKDNAIPENGTVPDNDTTIVSLTSSGGNKEDSSFNYYILLIPISLLLGIPALYLLSGLMNKGNEQVADKEEISDTAELGIDDTKELPSFTTTHSPTVVPTINPLIEENKPMPHSKPEKKPIEIPKAYIGITVIKTQGKSPTNATKKMFPIGDSGLTIGRATGNMVQLSDPRVSRNHCRLRWKNGHLLVDDCESKNATFINDTPLEKRHELKDNDILMLGDTLLRINIESS
jgi:uncharacterized protein YegL